MPDAPITLDDIRHKAMAIRTDVEDEVREQVRSRRNQIVIVGAVAVLAAFSLVYFLGARAGRSGAEQRLA